MSYSIIRVSKVKGKTNTTGIQKHVQRENKNYENADVDLTKSYMNYDLINSNSIDFNQKIDEKIEQNYNGKRKIRKDAIKHVDGIITSDNQFFSGKSDKDIKRFFEDSKAFLCEEYGEDNLLYATVHLDEATPHMHFGVVPLTEDGRLSAKDVLGNKKALTEFQDRFNHYINHKGHDLKRGTSKHKTERQHREVEQYKRDTEYYKNRKDEEVRKVVHFKTLAVDNKLQFESMQGQLETVKNKYNKMSKAIDRFEQKKLPKLKDEFYDIKNRTAEEKAKFKTLKQDIDQSEHKLKGLNADINHKQQAFNDLEAHIVQIRAKKEEEEEYYQSLKNVLYEPLSNEFEYEYKKRSLFSKESEPTGRVILKEEDYKTLKEQADFGKRIEPEYKKLIKGEKVQSLEKTVWDQRGEINDSRRKLNAASKKFERLTKEKDDYKSAYEDEQTKHENTRKFVKAVCNLGKDIFGGKNYRRIINKIDDNIHPKYKEAFRNMIALDREVMIMFKQKDEKVRKHIAFEDNATIKTKQEKNKGFDLEL
ncbi:TPA: plasmid recombination protein [Staphylococcus aureus]|nr:plasmid recombination protein [Staphylococcus aureus]HDC8895758.1 plasmid recombination protein [Staphylococcus aureus]